MKKIYLFIFCVFVAISALAQTPPNDDCANAITVTPDSDCINGSTDNATNAAPNGLACAGFNTKTVWYKFTATSTSHHVTARVLAASLDVVLAVYNGNCAAFSSTLACVDSYGVPYTESTLLTGLTIGNTYYIRISSPIADVGNFCVRVLSVPANDDCSASVGLTMNANCTLGNNIMATNTGVNPAAACINTTKTVWYHFTATQTSHYIKLSRLDLYSNAGTAGDLGFSVYGSTSGDCSTMAAVSCTDAAGSFATESAILAGLVIGRRYYIMVSGNAATDLAGFCIEVRTPPANDNCAGAVALTPNGDCTFGWTYMSTNTAPNPAVSCGSSNNTVWYSFVATHTNHTISLSNVSGFDAVFAVYSSVSNSCAGAFAQIACQDAAGADGNESLNVTGLTVGNTYFVMVAGNGAAEEGEFCIQLLRPPLNDACPDAETLTINSSCRIGSNENATPTGINPAAGCGNPSHTVWYKFVADATSHTVSLFPVSTTGGTSDVIFSLFTTSTDDCSGLFTQVGTCTDVMGDGGGEEKTFSGLTIGKVYFVLVAGFQAVDMFQFCISVTNNSNLCASAIPLGVNNACVAGGNTGATLTAGTDGGCQTPASTVWYKFTAVSTSSTVTVSSSGGFDAEVTVFSATGVCTGLTQIACRDAGGSGGTETANLAGLTIGATYYVMVDGQGTSVGSHCVSVRSNVACGANPQPANTCSAAPSISNLNGYCGVTSADYTSNQYNTLITGSPVFCNGGSIENNSFLQFTANGIRTTFQYTITTDAPNGGPPCDSGIQLQVYMVSGPCETGVWTPISTCPNPTGVVGTVGTITLNGLIPGQNYFIMFDGFAGDECGYMLNVLEDGVILPVELLSFNGKNTQEGHLLTWEAVEKSGFTAYEIERSDDGTVFGKIGEISAGNKSGNYSFLNKNIRKNNYYRLRMREENGQSEFSKIIYLGENPQKKSFMFYPNPSEGEANIAFQNFEAGEVRLEIRDIKGVLVKEIHKNSLSDNFEIHLSLRDLPAGLYLLSVSNNGEQAGTSKIVLGTK